MSAFTSVLNLLNVRHSVRKTLASISCTNTYIKRMFADKSKIDANKGKAVMVQGTENDERMRVRRARSSDVPRVLRFVREHADTAWHGLVLPAPSSHLILCDYVTRALAQGHSMLAEQLETRRGWSHVRGLALGVAVCPWDAALIERWAQCIKCPRSRRLLYFNAHCLRTPALHEKYGVHRILQIFLIVPQKHPKNSEIVQILAKNAIQRGCDVGFPVLRFDVTEDNIAKALEALKLKKEWQLSYDVVLNALKENEHESNPTQQNGDTYQSRTKETDLHYKVAVYTSVMNKNVDKT